MEKVKSFKFNNVSMSVNGPDYLLRYWHLHGDFSHARNGPTVIFDQSFGPVWLADALEADGIRIARAPSVYAVPDDTIRKVGDYYGGIIITKDHDFWKHPGSLVVSGHLGRHDGEDLGADIRYIHGKIDELPERPARSKIPYERERIQSLRQYAQQIRSS